MLYIQLIFIIFVVFLSFYYLNFYLNHNKFMIYNNQVNNYKQMLVKIKKLLANDFEKYNECIKITNIIDCGRFNASIVKKTKNITSHEFLFSKPSDVISNDLKECGNFFHPIFLFGIDTGPDYFAERFIYRKYYSKFTDIQFFFSLEYQIIEQLINYF